MRIAYVCPTYPPQIGGVETHVSSIAARLAERGHDVQVLAMEDGSSAGVDHRDGVEVKRFRWLALLRHLRRNARSWDVVHPHGHASPPAVAAALSGARPLVFTPHFHGFWDSVPARLYSLAIRPRASLVLRRAERVICVSQAESERLARDFPVVAERIVVIPNGTSRGRHADQAGSSRGPVLLSLGRLEDYKNVDVVIAALARLPPPTTLQVIGDGSARPRLAARAEREGVPERVQFLGKVDDARVDRALSESRVLVTMSMLEAFGIASLDAIAAGVPVVASDIPAHREMRERFGPDRMRLVPTGASASELARAIELALADGPREPPPDVPTWDRVADLTLALYREVVGGRVG